MGVGTGAPAALWRLLALLWPVTVERFSPLRLSAVTGRAGGVQLGLQVQDVVDDVLQDLHPAGGPSGRQTGHQPPQQPVTQVHVLQQELRDLRVILRRRRALAPGEAPQRAAEAPAARAQCAAAPPPPARRQQRAAGSHVCWWTVIRIFT